MQFAGSSSAIYGTVLVRNVRDYKPLLPHSLEEALVAQNALHAARIQLIDVVPWAATYARHRTPHESVCPSRNCGLCGFGSTLVGGSIIRQSDPHNMAILSELSLAQSTVFTAAPFHKHPFGR